MVRFAHLRVCRASRERAPIWCSQRYRREVNNTKPLTVGEVSPKGDGEGVGRKS